MLQMNVKKIKLVICSIKQKILRQLVSNSDPNLQRKLGWQCGLGDLLLMIAYFIFYFLLFYFPQSS